MKHLNLATLLVIAESLFNEEGKKKAIADYNGDLALGAAGLDEPELPDMEPPDRIREADDCDFRIESLFWQRAGWHGASYECTGPHVHCSPHPR